MQTVTGTDLQGSTSTIPGNTPINLAPPIAAAPTVPAPAPTPKPAVPTPTIPTPAPVINTNDPSVKDANGYLVDNPNYKKPIGITDQTATAAAGLRDPNAKSGTSGYYDRTAPVAPASADPAIASARAYQNQPIVTKTPEQIKAEELAAQKDRIDAILKSGKAAADRELGLGNNVARSYRGLLGMTGQIGSGNAVGVLNKTASDTNKNVEIENAKTTELINGVYDKVDAAVIEKLNAQKAENKEQAAAILDRAKTQGQDALTSYGATLGKNGVDFATAKTQDAAEFARIKDLTGMTDLQMETAYNNGIPEQFRPVTTESVGIGANGNAVIHRSIFNPTTGKASTPVVYDTGVPYNQYKSAETVKGGDGTQFMPNPADGGKTFIRVTPQTAEEVAATNLKNAQASEASANATKALEAAKNGTTSAKSGNSILNDAYVKNLFTADQLKTAADSAGFKTGGFLGMGKSADTEAYLKSVMTTVKAYQDAGYTDKQILEQMQK